MSAPVQLCAGRASATCAGMLLACPKLCTCRGSASRRLVGHSHSARTMRKGAGGGPAVIWKFADAPARRADAWISVLASRQWWAHALGVAGSLESLQHYRGSHACSRTPMGGAGMVKPLEKHVGGATTWRSIMLFTCRWQYYHENPPIVAGWNVDIHNCDWRPAPDDGTGRCHRVQSAMARLCAGMQCRRSKYANAYGLQRGGVRMAGIMAIRAHAIMAGATRAPYHGPCWLCTRLQARASVGHGRGSVAA